MVNRFAQIMIIMFVFPRICLANGPPHETISTVTEITIFVLMISISIAAGYFEHLRASKRRGSESAEIVVSIVLVVLGMISSAILLLFFAFIVALLGFGRGIELSLLGRKLKRAKTEEEKPPGIRPFASAGGKILIITMPLLIWIAVAFLVGVSMEPDSSEVQKRIEQELDRKKEEFARNGAYEFEHRDFVYSGMEFPSWQTEIQQSPDGQTFQATVTPKKFIMPPLNYFIKPMCFYFDQTGIIRGKKVRLHGKCTADDPVLKRVDLNAL